MADDLDIRRWTWKDKLLLWGIALLCLGNFILGVLTLGPDILHW